MSSYSAFSLRNVVEPITSFVDHYRFLSNFYPCAIEYNGYVWADSESAYQAMKSTDPQIHEQFAAIRSPGVAKRLGKTIDMRPDWDDVKYTIMHDIVRAKFDQHPELAKLLMQTGYAKIEEGNHWGDTTWGISPAGSGIGENALGNILMTIREQLVLKLPVDENRIYTGIGSRSTPPEVYEQMIEFAVNVGHRGWCLRSGGADGADSAFELGAIQSMGARHIYLPWAEFNGRHSTLCQSESYTYPIAARVHPQWARLRPGARSLMARNVHQVMGDSKFQSNSAFVICWTPDGCSSASEYSIKTGGTGMAIYIADTLGIPVFNLKNRDALDRAYEFALTLQ